MEHKNDASMTASDERPLAGEPISSLPLDRQGDADAVKGWRKATRQRLLAQRCAIGDADHLRWSTAIHDHLAGAFRDVASMRLGSYSPYQREFDAGPLTRELLANGAICALPVVVAPKRPLIFRRWQLDTPLETGMYGIPVPAGTDEVVPDVVLAPVVGFDARGYRLGYGSAFFDRTLAALGNRPTTIGIGFELACLDSIGPQPHDVPLDFIVTERGIRRCPAGGRLMNGDRKISRHFAIELER
jgi:5-formyltetrahydrofolate cyclo-ligase